MLFHFGTGLDPVPALAWLAPLPVLLVAPRTSARTAAALAFGSCLLGLTNSWAFSAHSHDLPLWPWGVAVTVGMAATFALSTALFRALLTHGRTLLAVTAPPAAWTAVLYGVAPLNPTGIMGTGPPRCSTPWPTSPARRTSTSWSGSRSGRTATSTTTP